MFALITASQLHNIPKSELNVLFREASAALVASDASSPARRNALVSMENINRARRVLRL